MPTSPPPVRLVVFDWGGVVLRICRSMDEGVAAAGLDRRALPETPELYNVRRGASLAYQVGAIGEAEFFEATSRAMGGVYTPEEVMRIHDAWLLSEYAGVRELIEALRAVPRLRTGVLSNTNERHWRRRLADFPAITRTHHPCASQDLRAVKPNAEAYDGFLRVVAAEGWPVQPAEVLFFDDLPENGEAARALGWRAERIDPTGDTAAQMRAALRRHGVAV